MPGTLEIMNAVRKGLDSLDLVAADSTTAWTKAVKTKLCDIGRGFDYQVCASGVEGASPEWLYDVIWRECECDLLAGVPLVAESEWAKDRWDDYWKEIIYDFNKLLLAREAVRVMIFDGSGRNTNPGSKAIAERLAARVRKFYGPCAEEGWLLAGWEPCGPPAGESGEKDWRFRYYTVGANAILL